VPHYLTGLRRQLSEIAEGLMGASIDLREISHGIHPRSCPVEDWARHSRRWLAARLSRPAPKSPSTEALTNAAKHARASAVRVAAHSDSERLFIFKTTEPEERIPAKAPA
jgi:hypothetical protein